MKKRDTFLIGVIVLSLIVLVAQIFSQRRTATIMALSATVPPAVPPTATTLFDNFPTHPPVTVSTTAFPLQATYTSLASETPNDVATPTLLPIDTPTLISSDTPPPLVFTPTLILLPTRTRTPFGGSPTPPVAIAYAFDDKPTACRKGPSMAYAELATFSISRIAAKNGDSSWWFLLVSKGQGNYVSCWVSADQVTTAGNLADLSVMEPALSEISQVKITVPDQIEMGAEYFAEIVCDDGLTNTTLHFVGQIFADGPIPKIGYRWNVDAPAKLIAAHTSVKSWEVPAQLTFDLPVPSKAASYAISLRTTFPVEIISDLRVVVQCK